MSPHLRPYCKRPCVNLKLISGCLMTLFEFPLLMTRLQTIELLTGHPPFESKGSIPERFSVVQAILEGEVPEAWLSDSIEYNALVSEHVASIETSLSDALHKDDGLAAAAAFIKSCLHLDPKKRLMSPECSNHERLAPINFCSCRFC